MRCKQFIKSRLPYSDIKVNENVFVETSPCDFLEFCNLDLENAQYVIKGKDNEGKDIEINVKITYNPEANFEYFTYKQISHDGTFEFIRAAMVGCLEKVVMCQTYNKNKMAPYNGCSVEYVIGNLVVANEVGNFGGTDKPWMKERTTVFLPIKYECEENTK